MATLPMSPSSFTANNNHTNENECTVETVKIVMAKFAKDIFPICQSRTVWPDSKCIERNGMSELVESYVVML